MAKNEKDPTDKRLEEYTFEELFELHEEIISTAPRGDESGTAAATLLLVFALGGIERKLGKVIEAQETHNFILGDRLDAVQSRLDRMIDSQDGIALSVSELTSVFIKRDN